MGKFLKLFKMTCLLAGTALLVSACGGGGGTTGSTGGGVQSTTLKGTAAAGASIIGTVTIKDSTTPTAQTQTVKIMADGTYTADVAGYKAPYMVRADGYVGGNEYHLYSAATSADLGGTINVTPLTDLIMANIAGSVAKTYFDNGSFSGLTAAQLSTEADALKAKLLPILNAIGVSGSIDLLRASFSTDHTGLDAVLDTVKITTDTTTNVATITNVINQEKITSNLSGGTYSGTLTGTGVLTGVTDIQAISAGFKQFTSLFANSVPSDTNPTLLALFDSATFMHSGEDLASFLSEITTDNSMIGIAFTNVSLLSMDTAKGTAVIAFDVLQNGIVQQDAPKSWSMIKKADGKWYMQGDQRIARVYIDSRAKYDGVSKTIQSGFRLDIQDLGGKGITSAVVTGKGLTAPVTLINNIAYSYFTIPGNSAMDYYFMTDTQIGTIADTGEVYTISLYAGTTLMATYTEKIAKRPYLTSELTSANFALFTSATVTQFYAFTGGDLPISWTLPAGLTDGWLGLNLSDISGNSAYVEYSLAPTATSKTATLKAQTSTGQTFIPAYRWLSLAVEDSYGRVLETVRH